MSLRECTRCHGQTKKHRRCKLRTCKIANDCYHHLRSGQGLAVKKSDIPNAGQGLFAAKDFETEQRVTEYKGERLSQHQLDVRYPGNTIARYTIKTGNGNYIDARSTQSGVARYVNACDYPGQERPCNAEFVERGNHRVYVETLHPVDRGEELLIAYGPEYYANLDAFQHPVQQHVLQEPDPPPLQQYVLQPS
jgi:hypothetical protein